MRQWLGAAVTAYCLIAAAPACAADPVVLQLKWLPDAQFAGYFVAKAKGSARGLGPGIRALTRDRNAVAEAGV